MRAPGKEQGLVGGEMFGRVKVIEGCGVRRKDGKDERGSTAGGNCDRHTFVVACLRVLLPLSSICRSLDAAIVLRYECHARW